MKTAVSTTSAVFSFDAAPSVSELAGSPVCVKSRRGVYRYENSRKTPHLIGRRPREPPEIRLRKEISLFPQRAQRIPDSHVVMRIKAGIHADEGGRRAAVWEHTNQNEERVMYPVKRWVS